MNIAPSIAQEISLALPDQPRQSQPTTDFLGQLIGSADASGPHENRESQDPSNSRHQHADRTQQVQPGLSQALGVSGVSALTLAAELYQNQAFAIGHLCYLDRSAQCGAITTEGRIFAHGSGSSAIARNVAGSVTSVGFQADPPQSTTSAPVTTSTKQLYSDLAEGDGPMATHVSQALAEVLEPWLRRRISVIGDGDRVHLLVRDFGASESELTDTLTSLIATLQKLDGKTLSHITVNGKPHILIRPNDQEHLHAG